MVAYGDIMLKQNFENILLEYKEFLEYISLANSLSEELVENGNIFLKEYCKSLHYNENFAEEFEINLLYLENFYQRINDMFELIDNVNLSQLKMPEINNILYFDNYIKIPDNYDEDIFVDLNFPIVWGNEKDED